jgi:5'-methylthioadenosine phosphorylase
MASPRIGIIAGSGLHALAGLERVQEHRVATPFGEPSDVLRSGTLAGREVVFLARHGAGHTRLPSEINYRANVFALKLLGVERILSVSAVGSMRATIRPRDVVVVDQFIDRTVGRPATFFGEGVAAHVALADPVCPETRRVLAQACRGRDVAAHDGGTYLCIEGPAFSTRAESRLYRGWGVDVIGMTNLPEARLAREAEICYATLALVTDYDCWHDDEEDVSVGGVLENLRANSELALRIVQEVVPALPAQRSCACGAALRDAIITAREAIPPATRRKLEPLLGRYLDRSP